MFREMRRNRQQLDAAECERILKERCVAVLALSGDDGYPYSVPVNYCYTDGKIIFHCAKSGHKLDAIRRSDKVSLCVIDKDEVVPGELTSYFRSVIVFGRARILEDVEEIRRVAEAFTYKYSIEPETVPKYVEDSMPSLCCVEISPEHISGKEAKELVKLRADGAL